MFRCLWVIGCYLKRHRRSILFKIRTQTETIFRNAFKKKYQPLNDGFGIFRTAINLGYG